MARFRKNDEMAGNIRMKMETNRVFIDEFTNDRRFYTTFNFVQVTGFASRIEFDVDIVTSAESLFQFLASPHTDQLTFHHDDESVAQNFALFHAAKTSAISFHKF